MKTGQVERKVSMDRCFNCGYMWADLDEEGISVQISFSNDDKKSDVFS